MRFSAIKKPLALLFTLAIIGAISLMAVNGVIGQVQDRGAGDSGDYAVPGVPGISLGPGTNTVALGVSIASQDEKRIYFQVNSFAVMEQQSQSFTVYDLSSAMPGIMDTNSNMVQIDIGKLQSSIQSTSQASMTDLYSVLRPSVNTLMVIADVTQQGRHGEKSTFQVQTLKVIMPDGQTNEFDLSQPMSIVVDGSAMRIFAVGFYQMYSLIGTYVTNIQNNYYTQINYNIVTGPVVVVSPPVYYPVLTPITFPRAWPVYGPVPVPVHIPVITVRPHPPSIRPSVRPSIRPTGGPSVGPTGMPTVSPTKRPSIRPSGIPTERPTFRPTGVPTATSRPTGIIRPTAVIRPTPGGGGAVPTVFRPSLRPATSFRPTPGRGGGVPTAFRPTIRQTIPGRPTAGGGGGGGMPIATRNPATGRVSPRGR